ncbi:MAG: acyltransferase family protein, partial [Desulfobacula sp.]
MDKFNRISKNFSVLKGFAALIVMFGHYTHISNFWVVVTIGMLIFSISSGYFTYNQYHGSFSWLKYWNRKFRRLVPRLTIIYIFLFVLFIMQEKANIWTIHTAVNLLGMNGILNWFRIQNLSPFGAGMWFLTLLILFYIFYPLLEKFYRNKKVSMFFTFLTILFLYVMSLRVLYSHALWLTASGFFIGLFLARIRFSFTKIFSLIGIVSCSFLML